MIAKSNIAFSVSISQRLKRPSQLINYCGPGDVGKKTFLEEHVLGQPYKFVSPALNVCTLHSVPPNATENPVCLTCIMLNETHKLVFNFLFHRFIEDRYKYMCEVAQSRAILSLGISCFKLKKLKPHKETKHKESDEILNIKVNTFNIVVLCLENFIVEPASLKFLVEHGFDFNKQYSRGVPYRRGDDQVSVYFP